MYKLLALLGGVDSSVDDDADAGVDGESSALPSASIDPSAAADQRKAKVQKTTNQRNITAGVVTQAPSFASAVADSETVKPDRGRPETIVAVS